MIKMFMRDYDSHNLLWYDEISRPGTWIDNQNRIIFDNSWTVPALKAALRPLAIFLKDSIQAPVAAS